MASKKNRGSLKLVSESTSSRPDLAKLFDVVFERVRVGYEAREYDGTGDVNALLARFDQAILALARARDHVAAIGPRAAVERTRESEDEVFQERLADLADRSALGRQIAMRALSAKGDAIVQLNTLDKLASVVGDVEKILAARPTHQERRNELRVLLEAHGQLVRHENLEKPSETVRAAARQEADRVVALIARSWEDTPRVVQAAPKCIDEIVAVLLTSGRSRGQPSKGNTLPKGKHAEHVEALFKMLGLEGSRSTNDSWEKRATAKKKK